MRVLVVEDDRALARVLLRGLSEDGHAVDGATTLADARALLADHDFHLVVLDLGLPDGDGMDLCQELRAAGDHVPVLVLTARDELGDRVGGLDGGADDYVTKPFDFPELSARVRALLRRPPQTRPPVLEIGDLVIDPAARQLQRAGVTVPITQREFALLHELACSVGDVVTRTELLERLWDANYDGLSNVVDVHVAGLRRKLGDPDPIETVRGIGYRLRVLEAPPR